MNARRLIPTLGFLLAVGWLALVGAIATPTIAYAQGGTPVALYLHGTGPDNNPPTLFLDSAAPAASTAKFKDSMGVHFSGGNPWKEVGAWPAAPALTSGTLTSLGNLHVWLGLKNSDDQGTMFDLRAEVQRNGIPVAAGESYCIRGLTRNPNNAKEVEVAFGSVAPADFDGTTDVLSLKVFARIGTDGAGGFCGGHSNAVGLRLYFDAMTRPAGFAATITTGGGTPPPTMTALAVSPTDVTLIEGQSQQLFAVAIFSDGTSQDVSGSSTWSSSDPEVATVDAAGLLTAESRGFALVTASLEEFSASGFVEVFDASPTLPPPSAIFITPGTMTLLVGETRSLALVDEFGRPVSGATWTVSNPPVIELSQDDPPRVTAAAAGTATLMAAFESLTAEAEMTVLEGTSLRPGTVAWSIPPAMPAQTGIQGQIVQAQPAGEGTPDLYFIESDPTEGTVIRGLTSDGRQLWVARFGGSGGSPLSLSSQGKTGKRARRRKARKALERQRQWLSRFMTRTGSRVGLNQATLQPLQLESGEQVLKTVGDTRGGALLLVAGAGSFGSFGTAIVRLDGANGRVSWRYESPGLLGPHWALHPDGTVYVVEQGFPGADLLALDSRTGSARFRIPIPTSRSADLNIDCEDFRDSDALFPSQPGPPMVAPDGSVYLELDVTTDIFDYFPCGVGTSTYDNKLELLRVLPDGSSTRQTLKHFSHAGPPTPLPHAFVAEAIPDGQDGIISAWTFSQPEPPLVEARITHVAPNGSIEYPLPLQGWGESEFAPAGIPDGTLVLGGEGVAFATNLDGASVVAFDVATGAVRWTWDPVIQDLQLVAAGAEDTLALSSAELELLILDPAGSPAPTGLLLRDASYWSLGIWHGTLNDGRMVAMAGPRFELALASWPVPQGNRQEDRASHRTEMWHFVPSDVTAPATGYLLPAQYVADANSVAPRGQADHQFSIKEDPTTAMDKFLLAVASPARVVAFIGHSVEESQSGQNHSIGLCFTVNPVGPCLDALIKKWEPGDPEPPWGAGPFDREVQRITTQAKIIFVASCNLGEPFKKLWDIDDVTQGRALVVSPTVETRLDESVIAWMFVAKHLVQGKTIAQAVAVANQVMENRGRPERWEIVGDPNVRIK